MLLRFAVTNYRGFARRIAWDLSRPGNYAFNTFAVERGIIKNGIIYGPNGSGKSNLALAVFDIVNHLSQNWKKIDYYNNFVYAGNPTAPVDFEYAFRLGDNDLDYRYAKDPAGRIVSESLHVDGREIFNRRGGELSVDATQFPMDATIRQNLAHNANNISIVNFLLTSYPLPTGHFLIRLRDFVNNMLWFRCLDTREFIGLETGVTNLDEYIIRHGLSDDFSAFLAEIDGQRFTFAPARPDDKALFCLYGEEKIPFDLIASTGTQALMLLYYWLKQMDRASFVFIDEFDAFYHFKLSYAVCKKLFSLSCQAFTSSHNTYLMGNDLLRPDCNFILNGSLIKPLSDCTEKELRFGHNIEKMFRGNAFQP